VPRTRAERCFLILASLTTLAVLLQGLWAGIFLEHDGERDAASGWITVHARCGEVAIGMAALAAAVALLWLRHRRALWLGAGALTVLLLTEAYIGGLIHDQSKDVLTSVHVPLAMALMGLAVWLPYHALRLAPLDRDAANRGASRPAGRSGGLTADRDADEGVRLPGRPVTPGPARRRRDTNQQGKRS
jgi:hypothetical protein